MPGALRGSIKDVQHVILCAISHRAQQVKIELLPDHGGGREDGTGVDPEPGDARTDDLAHALGQTDFLEPCGAHPSAVLLHDGTGLDEVQQHFAHEEGVAIGLA